jgi:hypothetical protein
MQNQHSSTRTRDLAVQPPSNLRDAAAAFSTDPPAVDSRHLLSSFKDQRHGHSQAVFPGTNDASASSSFHSTPTGGHDVRLEPIAPTSSDPSGFPYPDTGIVNLDWTAGMEFTDFAHYLNPVTAIRQQPGGNNARSKNDFDYQSTLAAGADNFDIQGGESTTYVSTVTPEPLDSLSTPSVPPSKYETNTQSRLKRKASDSSISAPVVALDIDTAEPPAKRTSQTKTDNSSRVRTDSSPQPTSTITASNSAGDPKAAEGSGNEPTVVGEGEQETMQMQIGGGSGAAGRVGATGPAGRVRTIPDVNVSIGAVLPAGKVFPIQIGSELFRLSGASISSDGQFNLKEPKARGRN